MAANQFGIDVAGMYKDVNAIKSGREALKGAKTRNKLSALNLSEQERIVAERPEKERQAAERANMLTSLRGGAVAGDQQAVQQLMAIDPEGGAKFIEALGKMDDRQIEAAKRTVDEVGKTAHGIMNIKDPVQRQNLYSKFYNSASPDVQKQLSPQFNMGEMKLALTKAASIDKILENPKSISVGGRDDVYKLGRKIDSGMKPVKDSGKSGSGSGGGLKSTDESLMYRMAGGLLGGIFNDKGEITNLDPQTRNKVQAIQARATELYAQSRMPGRNPLSVGNSVKEAGKEFGLTVPSYDDVTTQETIVNPATGETMVVVDGKWVPQK